MLSFEARAHAEPAKPTKLEYAHTIKWGTMKMQLGPALGLDGANVQTYLIMHALVQSCKSGVPGKSGFS